jgi:hypothetical protein
MLDKSVRTKKEELRKKWSALREIALDEKHDNAMKIRYKQDEIYNKWNFYDNLIKSIERENYEMQDQKNRKR